MTLAEDLVKVYGSEDDDDIWSKCVLSGGWCSETGSVMNQWDAGVSLKVVVKWKKWFPDLLTFGS